jgi:hypothetical protein
MKSLSITIRRSSFALLVLPLALGCGKSGGTLRREGSPEEAATKVMELYDGNKDGKITSDELAASPALVDGLSRIDTNRDGAIDLAEMTARFTAHDSMSHLVAFEVQVTSKRVPLDGAVITFTAEPFMGEGKQAYVGTTAAGLCQQLEGQERKVPGVPTGYYKVHIVHEASGTDATRGVEVADDTPSPNRLAFDTQLAAMERSRGR